MNMLQSLTLESREVANMLGKRHSDLLRDIAVYIDAISTNADLRSLDFFVESQYKDAKGEMRPCYSLTRRGCEFVANKMTGTKGAVFTATYINRFHEMEQTLTQPVKPVQPTDLQRQRLAIMERNSKSREASLWLKIAAGSSVPAYKDVANAYAANILAGREVLPLPEATEQTYSATDIGRMLGVSAMKIGQIANKHGLKVAEFGKLFYDKSRYSNKQVETFRYYPCAVDKFRTLLGGEA